MAECMNVSECQYPSLPLGPAHYEKYAAVSTSVSEPVMAPRTWALKLTAISVISIVWLSTQLQARRASKALLPPAGFKDPPQVPYFLPVLGNLLSYLLNPFGLASSIRCVIPSPSFFQFVTISQSRRLTATQANVWGFFGRSPQLSLEGYLPRKRSRVSQRRLEEHQRSDLYQRHQHFSRTHVRHIQGGHEGL